MSAPLVKPYIALSGLIGAGKSTLAAALAELLDVPVQHEAVGENPYLADFYADMETHAFPLQIQLLNDRFREQQKIVWSKKGAVQDRSLYEDVVFARMLAANRKMSWRNLATYMELFDTMTSLMRHPNLIVYLDVEPEEALRRINLRGRPMERGITLEYLRALREQYEVFLSELSRTTRVIRVNYAQFCEPRAIVEAIRREWTQTNIPAVHIEK